MFDREVVVARAVWRERVKPAGVIYILHSRTDISICIMWLYMAHKWLKEREEMEELSSWYIPANCKVLWIEKVLRKIKRYRADLTNFGKDSLC